MKTIKAIITILIFVFVGISLEKGLHVKDPWIYGGVFYLIGYVSRFIDSEMDN